jgi:hypothetical protein
MINYKFREGELLSEIKEYVDATYSQHYGGDKIQTSEVIVDRGRGMGFFLGNVDKYSNRYGQKGSRSDHRKDLLKVIHYGLLALYEHDRVEQTLNASPANEVPLASKTVESGISPASIDSVTPLEWDEVAKKHFTYGEK